MKSRVPFNPNAPHLDELDAKIQQALKEEGVIIPKTVEDVRRAKAQLRERPVTLPPHLRDAGIVFERIESQWSLNSGDLAPANVPPGKEGKTVKATAVGASESKIHTRGIFYRRAAFDAYIVHTLANDENLGRTKIEKITHLTEYHCGIDFERVPRRDAAGPVDYQSRRKVESLATKQRWYSVVDAKNRLGKEYEPGPNIEAALPVALGMMGHRRPEVDALIELLRPLDTKTCEIVATLYAAWNDLLLRAERTSDDDILRESRENWHPSKLTIATLRWTHALAWMRDNRLMPLGTGRRVRSAN